MSKETKFRTKDIQGYKQAINRVARLLETQYNLFNNLFGGVKLEYAVDDSKSGKDTMIITPYQLLQAYEYDTIKEMILDYTAKIEGKEAIRIYTKTVSGSKAVEEFNFILPGSNLRVPFVTPLNIPQWGTVHHLVGVDDALNSKTSKWAKPIFNDLLARVKKCIYRDAVEVGWLGVNNSGQFFNGLTVENFDINTLMTLKNVHFYVTERAELLAVAGNNFPEGITSVGLLVATRYGDQTPIRLNYA